MVSTLSVPPRIYLVARRILADMYKAVGMGTANQFRAIGSTVLVAITTALFNGFVIPHLSGLGISDPNRVIETYSQAETEISPEVWDEARKILSKGYNRQMFALVACGAAQAAVALLLWTKKNHKENSGKDLDGTRTQAQEKS